MQIIVDSILCALGGLGVGTFLLPLKFSRKWKWENSWMVGALVMYCILPVLVLRLVCPEPLAVYREAGPRAIIILFACGLIQGTGALVFTYGTTILGLALGYALMIGCISVVGLLVPMFAAHADRIGHMDGITLLLGLLILLVGISYSGKAGLLRERETVTDQGQTRKQVGLGIIIGVVLWSGIANSFYYFIHEWGDRVEQIAISHNVSQAFAPQFNNLPFFLGMLCINAALTFPKMMKEDTLKNYWTSEGKAREYFLAALIGLLWFLGQGVAFPVGKTGLGPLGISVGAALFMGMMIFISNILGVRTGEWKGVSGKTMKILYTGLTLLVIAMIVIAVGNGLQQGIMEGK